MPCEAITLPDGGRAIVCGGRRRQYCACGRAATRLCDWKTPTEAKPAATCSRPICPGCATSPAPGKDLCPDHVRAFDAWRDRRAPRLQFSSGERPDALPLPDPDAPAVPAAGVSATMAAQSRQALAAAKPETPRP